MKNSKFWWTTMVIVIFAIVTVTIMLWTISRYHINKSGLLAGEEYEEYQYHFVMIVEKENPFWESVYESAKQSAAENNAYLELLGANIAAEYSQVDYLKIARAEKVDGILIAPTSEAAVSAEVDEAVQNGIPVITMMEDIPLSKRQCFVGISNYNLGKEYGKQLLELVEEETAEILVLISSEEESNHKNLIFSGIKEVAENKSWNIQTQTIEDQGPFSTEEAIRNIIKNREKIPNILICLNSVETECAYQAVVDYNKVGEMDIIGFFDSKTILDAIDKHIIFSTITVDTKELGAASIETLVEYIAQGRVTNFRTIDANVINKSNVHEFLIKDTTP